MTEKAPDTGFIAEPVFARGFDPEQNHWTAPPRKSPWARHFELGRQNPGKWMKVSELKKGGCRDRLHNIQRDRNRIEHHLRRTAPLERWTLRQITVEGTWCDRELWIRYDCTLTPEEHELDLKRRRELWEARQATAKANKVRRAQEARDKAAEEEATARVRIRGRKRPGE